MKASANSLRSPSRPGLRKDSSAQRSSALFSSGVPVSATRTGTFRARTACEMRVSGFLTICASSRMSAENMFSAKNVKSFAKRA